MTAWRSYSTQTETFEIVGLYEVYLSGAIVHSLYSLDVYIPDSCLPVGFGEDVGAYVSDYSFVLNSAWEEDAFLAENEADLMAMGYTVSFVENNAENFLASVTPIRQSTAMSAAIFGAVLLIGLMLATFVYLRQRRREFAVCRALGVPSGKAARGLLLPGALLGFVGVALGGGLSWQYALNKAVETLATVEGPEGVESATRLSFAWLPTLIAAVFALYLLFLMAGLLALKRRPVLELLQGVAVKAKRARPTPAREGAAPAPTKLATGGSVPAKTVEWQPAAPRGTGRGFAAAMRFPLRYAVRSWGRSLLCGALALALMLALGYARLSIEHSTAEIDRLYETVVVEAEILKRNPSMGVGGATAGGFIGKETVNAVLESGMIQSHYLEYGVEVENVRPDGMRTEDAMQEGKCIPRSALYAFSSMEEFLAIRHSGGEISYGALYDESLFTDEYIETLGEYDLIPVVLPLDMVEQLGLRLRDFIRVDASNWGCNFIVAGRYTGEISTVQEKNPILIPFAALDTLAEKKYQQLLYSVAQFTIAPTKNRELPGFKEKMQELVSAKDAGLLELRFLFWDEELTQAIAPMEENIRLLSILYPVALALVALIGAGLSLLLVFQSAREAAALRALGVPKGRIRAMFTAQQGLLCLPGLLLGFLGLLLLQGDAAKVFSVDSLLCAGLYLLGTLLGAYFGAMAVTRRKPMELLQVKE